MAFAPVASGDLIQAETINNIVNGSVWYSNDSGTANAYRVTFDGTGLNGNTVSVLASGQFISFGALYSNSGASTLTVVGVGGTGLAPGPLNITKGGRSLVGGEIRAGQIVQLVYNGNVGSWELLNSAMVQARGVELLTSNPHVLPNLTNVPNPIWTANTWQSDPGYWSTGSNVITIPAGLGGKYFVKAVIQFPVIPNSCVVALGLNAGSPLAYVQHYIPPSAGAHTVVDISAVLTLTAGATLYFFALQNTGAEVTLVSSGSSIQAVLIGA